MSKLLIILFSACYSTPAFLIGQEVTLTGNFLPYETYYVSSIDITTGESDIQMFEYIINRTDINYDSPIELHISFKVEILSPDAGFSE